MSWFAVVVGFTLIASPSLQERVDAIAPGGTLDLAEGDHFGPLEIKRPMTIRGRGPEKTVVRASSGTVVVVSAKGGEVILEGLTLTGGGRRSKENGGVLEGGALRIEAQAAVVLREVVLHGNHGANQGGAIFSRGALRGTHVRLEGNSAHLSGGAIAAIGDATIELEDSLITGNWATGLHRQVFFGGKSLILRRVVLKDPGPLGSPKGVQLTIGRVRTHDRDPPPDVLLDTVTIGPVSGTSIIIGGGPTGVATVTLIDTEWPADAEVPAGWKPQISQAKGIDHSLSSAPKPE